MIIALAQLSQETLHTFRAEQLSGVGRDRTGWDQTQVFAKEVLGDLIDVNVAGDRQTITLLVKNDGNVDFRVSSFALAYGAANQNFVIGSNVSLISGVASMKPGSLLTARFKIATTALPSLSSFTITIVADQLARAFNVEG